MPAPVAVLIAYATGVWASRAAQRTLLRSARPATLTQGFWLYTAYLGLVFVPATVFAYMRYADWSVLYLFEASTLPSVTLAVVALLELVAGQAGFLTGAAAVRRDRRSNLTLAWIVPVALSFLICVLSLRRLSVVTSYVGYVHGFAQLSLMQSGLGAALILNFVIVTAGFVYVWLRLRRL